MKRIGYLVAAALLLAACSSNTAPEPSAPEELIPEPPAETAESAPETAAPSSHPLLHSSESSGSPEPQPQSESEVFVSESEQFSGAYSPSVTFFDDGTFVMHENLYEGMGDYSGTYSFDGAYYDCTVADISFSGFAGDKIRQFSFLKYDADTLVLLDTLCGSQEKDVFVRSNGGTIKPAQEVGTVSTVRHYVSSSTMFSDPYMPELVLNPDGTFVLTENLFSGMGHYSGTFTSEDYNLTLHVEKTDFSGYAGDDVTEIRFEALSEDVLQLMDDLCGSVKFDTWYRTAD